MVYKSEIIKNLETVSECKTLFVTFLDEFSSRPDKEKFPYPKTGDVLDEEKSVKWNREEVLRLREAYNTEALRLNQIKNNMIREFEAKLISLLSKEYSITVKESEILYKYAYEESHSDGVYEIIDTYRDYAEMYDELKEIKKNS